MATTKRKVQKKVARASGARRRRISPSKRPVRRGGNAGKLHKLITKDEKVRHALYSTLGRVRCYLYKYGKSVPAKATAECIEKLTRGKIRASGWKSP